jgi:acetolactate synthase I/II/III large subunit
VVALQSFIILIGFVFGHLKENQESKVTQEMTVADYFAHFIAEKKVPAVFELSGGMIAFLTDAIYRLGKTKIVNTRHEQSAGFAAEGASRATGIPNIAMGTSGPGATNLITAIGSAYFDSTPTIFITGQVHTLEIKNNLLQRQNGFQELDILSATKSLTKFSSQVLHPDEFPAILSKAWKIAIEGRPGPVLIDIPIDVQQKFCLKYTDDETFPSMSINSEVPKLQELVRVLKSASAPLILAGGGLRSSGTVSEFVKFVDASRLPVVHTLMGKDVLPTSHPLNLGFIGSYGNRWANRAMSRADVLIVLGSRLDVRQTGSDIEDFKRDKFIVRVDVDKYELEGRVEADINIRMSLNSFFELLNDLDLFNINSKELLSNLICDRQRFSPDSEQEVSLELSPDYCVNWISENSQGVAGFCVDVGQHQMWAAQSIKIDTNQRFLTSGGMGAMGFSIPASIGAATATGQRWFTVTGDGCMQLSLAELQTISHYNLPITIFVFNNHQHGMVAQFQDENMDGRYVSTRIGYSAPDFCAVANAYRIKSLKVQKIHDFDDVKLLLKENPDDPILIEIIIDNRAKALPKLDRFTKLSQL